MFAPNISINVNAQTLRQEPCPFLGKYQWRPHYLTQTVYCNMTAAILFNAVACPVVVLCNAFVVFCVVMERTLRRKESNVLLSLLAVTDLVVGIIVYPIFIASLSCRINGQCDSCQIDTAAFFLLIICGFSSLFHLVLIALDRFIAIKLALRYKDIVTIRKIVVGTVVAWTTAFVVSLSPLYSSRVVNYLFLLFGTIPVLVICSCYAVVYFESRRHNRNIQAQIPHGQQENNSRRHEFKASKTTFIVTVSVLIYFTPSAIALCKMDDIGSSVARTSKTSLYFTTQTWVCTALMLNSLSNPLIYSYRTRELRKAIKKMSNRLRNRVL